MSEQLPEHPAEQARAPPVSALAAVAASFPPPVSEADGLLC